MQKCRSLGLYISLGNCHEPSEIRGGLDSLTTIALKIRNLNQKLSGFFIAEIFFTFAYFFLLK